MSDVEYGSSISTGGGVIKSVSNLFTKCACVHFSLWAKPKHAALALKALGHWQGSAQTGVFKPFRNGACVCIMAMTSVQRHVQEQRASQINNKLIVGLKSNPFTWMPFIYDSPFTPRYRGSLLFSTESQDIQQCVFGAYVPFLFLLQGQAAVSC